MTLGGKTTSLRVSQFLEIQRTNLRAHLSNTNQQIQSPHPHCLLYGTHTLATISLPQAPQGQVPDT